MTTQNERDPVPGFRWRAVAERWTSLRVAVVVLGFGLWLVGIQNLQLLNGDAIAYLRLAHYWVTGQTALMVSGYWGPLLSWLMVPWLGLGAEPLVAARLAMGISGFCFWCGLVALARAAGLRPGLVRLAAWLSMPATWVWSVESIVPDLLVGGLVALAAAQQLSPSWLAGGWRAWGCGATWAAAYLAKAIAFPLGFLVMVLFSAAWLVTRVDRGPVWRAGGLSLASFVVLSLPWISVLSLKYRELSFSTSGRIAHAVVGPPDSERSHPFGRTFHEPEPGRITAWEDPSKMAYAYWSPFESANRFRYQLQLIKRNLGTVFQLIGGLGWFGIPFFGLLLAFWPSPGWRGNWTAQRWRWGAAVVVGLSLLYLPVYVAAVVERYFYPAWPFIVVACLGAAVWVGGERRTNNLLAVGIPGAVALGLVLPMCGALRLAVAGIPDAPSLLAQDLATRIRRAGVSGTIAGSGQLAGGRVGLMTAYLIGQRWVGEGAAAGVADYLDSGASLAVVLRQKPVAQALANDARVTNLDPDLFGAGEEPANYPLQVFRLESRSRRGGPR